MILFLTGATSSLRKSDVAPQADPNKSLGGWVSSSPVPNAALNELFDLVSTGMLSDRPKETLALGLINQLNRYSEPLSAVFYDATFQRASVEFDLNGEPIEGDQFLILPLNITIDVIEKGVKGFWNGLKTACKRSSIYIAERLSDRRFRISYADETIVSDDGIECRCVKDSDADINFIGKMRNGSTNSVILVDSENQIAPGDGVGLWLQREVSADWERPTDQELIEMKKRGEILPTVEQAEVVITYDEATEETTEEQGE